jgi:hypothetical protein
VQVDAQVRPIVAKANELAEQKHEYRQATELYRRILQEYPDELYQIAAEGIFVPATLYVQRRILAWFGHYLKGEPAEPWITLQVAWLSVVAAHDSPAASSGLEDATHEARLMAIAATSEERNIADL